MDRCLMTAAQRLEMVSDFIEAVRRHDLDRADRLWSHLSGMLPDACWSAAGQLHMARDRWAEAAEALSQLQSPDDQQKLHLMLSRNLGCMKSHRPDTYHIIANAAQGAAYQIHPSKSGLPSILATREDGTKVLLAGGTDPRQAGRDVCKMLQPQFEHGKAIAILSIGDGYVFDAIVRNSPHLHLGRRQPIYLLEPDPRLILACMLLHDFTGRDGPIESTNVYWFTGSGYAEQFRLAMLTERFLAFPQSTIKLGFDQHATEAVVHQVFESLEEIDKRCTAEVKAYYASISGDTFARVIGGQSDRMPRVLLITTRFSTVLQYSTRDTADAFRQLGFDVHLMIEPSAHHGLTKLSIKRVLSEFKPDLIFQIDHNRFEHADLFPDSLPFVNWVQDFLPQLMKRQTGQRIGLRDYVLTPSRQRWVDEYAYPERQCLEFRKLTRIPDRPISWTSRSDSVVYVSNWSQSPDEIRQEILESVVGKNRDLLDAACQRMIATYLAGGSLASIGDVRRLLIDVMRELKLTAPETLLRQMSSRLFDRMNNLLFRQQGLLWARRACDALDLKLQIYGTGWDQHPNFGEFACGSIEYGAPLENLTRAAGVNLVLEPFVCIAHQRLLDALAAGGFCLMRANPATQTIHATIELLAMAGDDAESMSMVRDRLGESHQNDLDQLQAAIDAIDASPGAVDHFALTRQLQQSGFFPSHGPLLPMLEQTTFDNADHLVRSLARFSRDPGLRSDIARAQRQAVEQRYNYVAGMRQVIRFITTRLQREPQSLAQAA